MPRPSLRIPALALLALVVAVGCASRAHLVEPAPRALDNVWLLEPGLYSGSGPAGDAAFDALAALGVRTILSVDAAPPDADAAAARGIRTVHVPIGYDGIDDDAGRRIARTVRDLPRPLYVHCHHGRHRGPTAAAFGLVALGRLAPDDAVALMERLGTSPSYPGLYRTVGAATPLPAAALATVGDDDLPARAVVSDLAARMARIDAAFANVEHIAAAGWTTPSDHPDLVPIAEAGLLTELLRGADRMGDDDFDAQLREATTAATALETAVAAGRGEIARTALARLAASCVSCHRRHRN